MRTARSRGPSSIINSHARYSRTGGRRESMTGCARLWHYSRKSHYRRLRSGRKISTLHTGLVLVSAQSSMQPTCASGSISWRGSPMHLVSKFPLMNCFSGRQDCSGFSGTEGSVVSGLPDRVTVGCIRTAYSILILTRTRWSVFDML